MILKGGVAALGIDILGLNVEYGQPSDIDCLPIYISEAYDIVPAIIEGRRCTIISPRDELVSLLSLERHMRTISGVDGSYAVLSLPSISPYRRKRLIERKVPFITDRQAYLPFLCAYLTNEVDYARNRTSKLRPSAQQMILLYLYGGSRDLYLADATAALGFTPMTSSKGARQIEATGLFDVRKDGVNKVISSMYAYTDLFKRCAPYLSSPVRNAGYIWKTELTGDMALAGESLLSEKSALSACPTTTYAVYERLFDKGELHSELIDPSGQAMLELWKYDPRALSPDNYADPLSVALSLSGCKDERVESAVDEMVREVFA